MGIIEQSDDKLVLFLNVVKNEDYDMLVDFYNYINRSYSEEIIKEKIYNIFMDECQETQKKLWVLTFYIRNPRGGKGEKDLFFLLLKHITQYSPIRFIYSMLKLIPQYGCWKDIMKLLDFEWVNNDIKSYLIYIIQNQLEEDKENYSLNEPISYLAKWLPREKSNKNLVKKLANSNTSCEKKNNYNLMIYRQQCSMLNKYLETTEILMCNNKFSEINPEKVPKICYEKYRNAFLKPKVINDDRTECIQNFINYIKPFGNNKVTFPLEVSNEEELNKILNSEIYDLVREAYENDIKFYESPIESTFSFE